MMRAEVKTNEREEDGRDLISGTGKANAAADGRLMSHWAEATAARAFRSAPLLVGTCFHTTYTRMCQYIEVPPSYWRRPTVQVHWH